MKNKRKYRRRKSLFIGANSAFNIVGDDLEMRRVDNIEASWFNVGIFFKRSINNVSLGNGYGNRYSSEELETF